MDSALARKIMPCLMLFASFAGVAPAEKPQAAKGELLSVVVGKGLDGVASHRFPEFTVQVGDVVYTGSGKRIHHPLDDYNEGYNAGDAVEAEIRGNEMTIKKPGGRTVKTKIMKKVPANESLN